LAHALLVGVFLTKKSNRLKIVPAFLFFLIFAFFSQRSYACAVCGFGESSRLSFLVATLILTLVPLITIGGIFYFVYRSATSQQAEVLARSGPALDSSALFSGVDESSGK
jgi:hypothetical protein